MFALLVLNLFLNCLQMRDCSIGKALIQLTYPKRETTYIF